ncbi:MAG: hypothetical protein ACOH15_08655 [Acetobacterium sp.]
MNDRIRQGMKNSKGSSLAFVLIISMVLMVMVASIMTVANSDFTFTQKTVESRQAYIDAKSVIEFGKIEINDREKKLSDANTALVEATNNNGSTALILQTITQLESKVTTIYGNEKNVGETLSFTTIAGDGKISLGQVAVEKNVSSITTTESSKYVFKVITENLRRKLDYQVDFNYVVTTTPGSSGSIVTPTRPVAPQALGTPNTNTSSWLSTQIIKEGNWPGLKCIIATSPKKEIASVNSILSVDVNGLDIKVDKFDWTNNPVLNLSAKNISFKADVPTNQIEGASFNITAANELRFEGNYSQNYNQNKVNKLKAENIIFEGDLVVGSNTGIEIDCENLWIKGDFIINTNNKDVINRINAKNIIIGDYTKNNRESKLEINGASNVVWQNLENLWIKGNLNFNNWNSNNEIQNIINAKNIIINDTQNKHNGEIEVNSHSKLNLTCTENLWVGNIAMNVNDSSLISNIKAAQIIIEDTNNRKESSVFVGDKTNVVWDATNFWVDGKISTGSTAATQMFKNINYLSTDDIELNDKSKLTVEGADGKKNQMTVGSIKVINSNNVIVDISKFCYLTCYDLNLNDNSTLKINVGAIKINNNFTLSRGGISEQDNSLDITCEYFDCSGITTISNLKDDLNFNPKNSSLNMRFYKGYSQENSTVNINGANKVIFGPSDINNGGGNDGGFNLKYQTSLKLNVKSDNIYLASDSIDIQNGSQFMYEGKTNAASNTNIYIESDIGNKKNPTVINGTYENVVPGIFPAGLTKTGNYPSIVQWSDSVVPSCLGSSGGSTITISSGTETYY